MSVGVADWKAKHSYNPLWPPHDKHHNAQTMAFGALLGIAGLVFACGGAKPPARTCKSRRCSRHYTG